MCEVLVPKGPRILLPESKSMLKGLLPDARFSLQPAQNWESDELVTGLNQGSVFAGKDVPLVLREAAAAPERHDAMLRAFAGMRSFLKRSMLEDAVLRVGSVERLPGQHAGRIDCGEGQVPATEAAASADEATNPAHISDRDAPRGSTMVLDASALSNLEVWLAPIAECLQMSRPMVRMRQAMLGLAPNRLI